MLFSFVSGAWTIRHQYEAAAAMVVKSHAKQKTHCLFSSQWYVHEKGWRLVYHHGACIYFIQFWFGSTLMMRNQYEMAAAMVV